MSQAELAWPKLLVVRLTLRIQWGNSVNRLVLDCTCGAEWLFRPSKCWIRNSG